MLRKLLAILLLSLISSVVSTAQEKKPMKVPANPKPIEFTQPDNSVITIRLKGDERIHWAETLDGYTLLKNSKGGYEYAIHNKQKNLVPSGVLAHKPEERKCKEKRFIRKTPKGLYFSDEQVEQRLIK